MSARPRRTGSRSGASAALLVAIMFLGGLVLWVGIPLLWLYIGSVVEGATDSVGAAIGVMMFGSVANIVLWVPLLGWLNHKREEARAARGLQPHGQAALEGVLVVSATVALVIFCVWFFLFAGTGPLPVPSR